MAVSQSCFSSQTKICKNGANGAQKFKFTLLVLFAALPGHAGRSMKGVYVINGKPIIQESPVTEAM